jgi:hypothetical protein
MSQNPNSYQIETGTHSNTKIIVSSYGLCVAAVNDLQSLNNVILDLKAKMAESDSPSGSICIPQGIAFDVPDRLRRQYANMGISFFRSEDPDPFQGAVKNVIDYNARIIRQGYSLPHLQKGP